MKRHLSTLSILHYVYGAFICLLGLSMLALVFLGVWVNSPWVQEQMAGDGPEPLVGFVLSGVGGGYSEKCVKLRLTTNQNH
ncbi:MAG TPA: hypothetical protein PKD45_13765, partial [Flavobacteriales bacterium]|nr:hypothetical protein [Flavobacteriales bacterium]